MEDTKHWITLSPRPRDATGFLYYVVSPTTRTYIGRKSLVSVSKRLPAGAKRRVITRKESDWLSYTSSCRELLDDISLYGIDTFSFVIYDWCFSKGMLTYMECKDLWDNEVLSREETIYGDRQWYNANIGAVKFLKPKV